MKRKLWLVAGGAIAVAVVVGAVLVLTLGGRGGGRLTALPAGDLGLDLKPTASDSLGVDPKTSFLLTSVPKLSVAQVEKALRVTPATTVSVESKADGSFKVAPTSALTPDASYRFTFVSPETDGVLASWAYQVASPLHVVSTVPNDQQTFVPLDTGIEVSFSSDGVVSPESLVKIDPPTPGRFEQHKRTLVFVPQQLQPSTLYTVTVSAGLTVTGSSATLEEPATFQFETGQVRRSGPPPPSSSFLRRFSEAGTQDPPLIAVDTTDGGVKVLPVTVYQYATLPAFLGDLVKLDQTPVWASYSRDAGLIDPAALQVVASFTADVKNYRDPRTAGGNPSQPYIALPAALGAGFYLVQAQYGDKPVQTWLEVTNVASFVSVSGTKTLVWVNDVSTGGPVASAKVELAGGATLGMTDDQGVVEFDTPAAAVSVAKSSSGDYRSRSARGSLIVTDPRGAMAVVPLNPAFAGTAYYGVRTDYQAGAANDYWRFLTTDRPVYQPTDKISFWGVAKSRDGDAKRELTAELRTRGTTRVGTALQLKTDDFGTFNGDISLDGVSAGYYSLYVTDGSDTIVSTTVQVEQYIKPAYRILANPSKTAVTSGDSYAIDLTTEFYDGTPAPGVELKYTAGKERDLRVTTDEGGKAQVNPTAAMQSTSGYTSYENQTITFSPARAEEGQISGSANIIVFPATIGIATTTKAPGADGKATISGDAANIDLALFTQGYTKGSYGYSAATDKRPPYRTTPVANLQVSLDITETFNVPTETGDAYDFVNKVAYKTYRYTQQRRPRPSVNVTTDAQGKFSYSFSTESNSDYQIVVTAKDAQGRGLTVNEYVSARSNVFLGGSFTQIEDSGDRDHSNGYAVGDKVSVAFKRGDEALTSGGKNRYLFYEAQRGLKRHAVQDTPAYNLTFTQEDVPSVDVGGVYFNGFTYVEALSAATLRFDTKSRALNIALSTPAKSYKPGDEATVEVSITDAAGKPVQAEVSLAAVDEALFSVEDFNAYETAILAWLYRSVPSGIMRTYVSHQYPVDQTGGGRGGGGGGPREVFEDVAYFGRLRTGADGKGRVSFRLPDNLTSWRLTAYAVSGDLKAGHVLDRVAVSQPFFVDLALNPDYVLGDKPIAKLTAFGAQLKAGDEVQVSLLAPGLSAQPLTASGKAFQPITIPLPELKTGRYQVEVKASSGALQDAIGRTVTVLPSRLLAPSLDVKESVKAGDSLKGASDGPTTLLFADAGRGRFFPLLQRLRWTYGDRFDQTLARVLATRLLNQYFDQQLPAQDFAPGMYLTAASKGAGSTKGVALLPFASPDLAATAQTAALDPSLFGATALREYLNPIAASTSETPERVAIALYGLAALGDPVLLQAQALGGAPDLGWRGRIYLALALQTAGDDAGARTLLGGLVKEYGEDQAPYKRLRVGTNQDDILEATSLAAILGAGLSEASADAYFRYVQQNAPTDYPTYLAQLSYLKTGLERAGAGGVRFGYAVDGRRQTVSLEKGKTWSISLSPAQMAGFKVESVQGALAATSSYLVAANAEPSKVSPDLSIRRSFSIVGGQATGGAIPQSGLVQVTLEFSFGAQALGDCYQITDLLPSGLKPVTLTALGAATALAGIPVPTGAASPIPATLRPNLVSGQIVTFCAGRGGPTRATYFARPSGLGSFRWEAATINSRSAPSVRALSAPSSVEIR